MITTSKCTEWGLAITLSLLMLGSWGCERDKEPRRFSPGGQYFQLLDGSGRKHIVVGEDDEPVAKLRVRDDEIKVYDAEMLSRGTVEWGAADREGVQVTVTPRGEEPTAVRRPGDSADVYELSGHFRVERVERGWVVFDSDGRRLGYVEELDAGEYAVRDDYSSPERAYARKDQPAVKTPSGRTIVDARPEYRSAPLLGFVFEGDLDVLARVAFGIWLEKQKPR